MDFYYPFPTGIHGSWDGLNDFFRDTYDGPQEDYNQQFTCPESSNSRYSSAPTMDRYLNEEERHLYHMNYAQPANSLPGLIRPATLPPQSSDPCQRHSSPTSSGGTWDSRDTSCTSNYCRSPSYLSLEVSGLEHATPTQYDNTFECASGGQGFPARRDSHIYTSCVALPEIQRTADDQTEALAFDKTTFYTSFSYGAYPQEGYQAAPEEGYQPMQPEHDSTYCSTPSSDQPSTTHTRNRSEEPVIRRRRNHSECVAHGRIHKRPSINKRTSSFQIIKQEHGHDELKNLDRAFTCPLAIYGCTSAFSAKNEWKRHVYTQHLRLGFWRCERCAHNARGSDRKFNDFNRKDLFMQHVRRKHPLETPFISSSSSSSTTSKKKKTPSKALRAAAAAAAGDDERNDEIYVQTEAAKCYKHLRDAPEHTACLFCEETFLGRGSWEERMEHIGRHMEEHRRDGKIVGVEKWRRDEGMERWLRKEQIIRPWSSTEGGGGKEEEEGGRLVCWC